MTTITEIETRAMAPCVEEIKQNGVEARASHIQGAGQGLFAVQSFAKGDVICEYVGQIYPNKEAWQLTDKAYLMKLGDGKYVDAREHPDVMARYINDCRSKGVHNVVFEKRPQENKALVLALREIQPGDELYVDYGRFYWLAYNLMHPDSPVR